MKLKIRVTISSYVNWSQVGKPYTTIPRLPHRIEQLWLAAAQEPVVARQLK